MDKQDIVNRIDQLLVEKHLTMNSLMNDADISTTVYQWKSNRNRDATRIPSLKSIMKICESLGISLSYFFATTKIEEMSVKQAEISNRLFELTEEELDAISLVIDVFINNKHKGENKDSLNG